jgi:hypothetical protein
MMAEIDYHLRNQVDRVQQMVLNLEGSISTVGHQVAVVSAEQKETRSDLAALYQDFLTFRKQSELNNNKQNALVKVGNLEDKLEYQFGINKRVRNNAIGMLQAFDEGLVTEETALRVGEELMMEAKEYWLAPVLVALSAWASNERDLCDRAVTLAFRRSPSHTSLFMALVLRRQGRQEASVRWLRHYLNAQDPRALGRNFAVILESVAHGAFGPSGMVMVREFLDRWSEQLAQDEAAQTEQVRLWRMEMEQHRSISATGRYPRLAAVSPEWPQMDKVVCSAEAHRKVLDKYTAMLAEELPTDSSLEDRIDDILDRLVKDYDDPELPMRRDMVYQQAIVDNDGDIAQAQLEVASTFGALETKLSYLTVQTQSALNPSHIGVSRSTQRIAVASCHEWFRRAVTGYTMDYRTAVPPDVTAVFESKHNVMAQFFQLPRWQGSFTKPIKDLEADLGGHWDRHTQPFIDGLAAKVTGQIVAAACVSVGLLAILSCGGAWAAGIIIALLVGGVWGAVINNKVQQGRKAQEQARTVLAQAKQDSITQLRAARAELTDWATEFRRSDANETDLRTFIDGLAVAGHNANPFQRRTTLTS